MPAERETYLFYRLVKERLMSKEFSSDYLASACPDRGDYHQAQVSAYRAARITLDELFTALNKFGTKEEWLNA